MRLNSFSCLIPFLLFLSSLIIFTNTQPADYSIDYDSHIFFHWEGALTSHSLNIKVFPQQSGLLDTQYETFVVLYTNPETGDPQDITITPVAFTEGNYSVTEVTFGPLNPSTKYSYSFVFVKSQTLTPEDFLAIYAQQKPKEFTFWTLGIALTPYNFTFGAASCAQTGSNSTIFNALHNEDFSFFIHMGDLHYSNILENEVEKFYQAYHNVFSSNTQKSFFQDTPVFYVWDDHDFGYGTSPACRPAVTQAYKDFVPYGALKNDLPSDDASFFPESAPQSVRAAEEYLTVEHSSGDYGVFRSFLAGRCLFIIMDLRSFINVEELNILGDEQLVWLENQLRFAGKNKEIAQVFLVGSFPWISEAKATEWTPFTSTQQKISSLVKEHINGNNKQLMMLSGDAHMIAFDDGSNNVYGGFPVVQAASLDQKASCKGGPYSHGIYQGPGHYGSIEVSDYENGTICVKVNLKDETKSLITYDTCNPELTPRKQSMCPVSPPPHSDILDEDDKKAPTGGVIWWILVVIVGAGMIGIIALIRKKSRSVGRDVLSDSYVEMSNSARGGRGRGPNNV